MLDEPTSGLDPIVRREFIQTVIGAYQDGKPGQRTVFVSTHLISEFEGLIDQFTIIEHGRDVLTLDADVARTRYQKIYARFANDPGTHRSGGAHVLRRQGREVEVVVNGNAADVTSRLKARSPETLTSESLTLEEIFVATLEPGRSHRMSVARCCRHRCRRKSGHSRCPRSRVSSAWWCLAVVDAPRFLGGIRYRPTFSEPQRSARCRSGTNTRIAPLASCCRYRLVANICWQSS